MWPPANSHALPSVDETIIIKQAIVTLEDQLTAAVTLLQQTQLHIAELQKGLEERRAWIAPIRKVPFEVLSDIFIICGREERFAPMIIAAVSRRWRDTILATPLAWCRIFPYAEKRTLSTPPVEYVSTFLKRSHPCLVHIRTGRHQGGFICEDGSSDDDWECNCDNVLKLFEYKDRIQCLRTGFEWIETLEAMSLARLERLVILLTSHSYEPKEFSLDISLLPSLWYLDVRRSSGITRMVKPSSITQSQLRHLSVDTDRGGVWFDLINLNSKTLKTLKIFSHLHRSARPNWALACPALEHIFIKDHTKMDPTAPIVLQIVAPLLVFCEFTTETRGVQLVHLTDFNKIVLLRTSETIPLREYRHIRVLQLFSTNETLLDILDQLDADDSICTELHVIEIRYTTIPGYWSKHGVTVEDRIALRNTKANSHIELLVNFWPEWKYGLPENDATVSSTVPSPPFVSTADGSQCEDFMPCSLRSYRENPLVCPP
jgi:hypothetical protein